MHNPHRTRFAAAAAAISAIAFAAAPAAAADNADANGTALLLDGFGLVNTDGLEFGRVATSSTGGVIAIDAATGTVTTAGNVAPIGADRHRARFTANAPVGIILIMSGQSSVVLTRQGGTETMTAALTYARGGGLVTTNVFGLPIGLLATDTEQEIWAGGTLTVGGTQAQGEYEGTFTLSVAYL